MARNILPRLDRASLLAATLVAASVNRLFVTMAGRIDLDGWASAAASLFGVSAVVWIALVGSCVASGICGALVPLTLKKYGFDPATASSIFLTTATDVVSMGLLLGLATLLVPIST